MINFMLYEDYDSPVVSNQKKVRIYRNGNFSTYCDIKVTSTSRFSEIRKMLEQKLEKGFSRLRLYNHEGVEIMEDDIEFIKNGASLYASKGEEFDSNSTFSEYEIVKELGEGGFGKVVLGIHKITKSKVAIKIIKTYMIGNAQDIDMVFREAEILKSLKHKNIVKIFNCFTLSNMQVIFIMEYLEGGELLELLDKKGHFEEDEARNYFKQIVSAMAYCHGNKMVHRDLKLENLLLVAVGSDQVKAIDFGIAGLASVFNVDTVDAGSLRYMAPELLSGQCKQINGLVDVWSMGVILYGMLFGKLAFNGDSNKDIIDAIILGHIDLPKDKANKLSKACIDCLYKCLEVDPTRRITSTDLQYHPWLSEENSSTDVGIAPHLHQEKIEEKKEEHSPQSVQRVSLQPALSSFSKTKRNEISDKKLPSQLGSQKLIGSKVATNKQSQVSQFKK